MPPPLSSQSSRSRGRVDCDTCRGPESACAGCAQRVPTTRGRGRGGGGGGVTAARHGHAVELYHRHNDELREMGALAAAKDTVWSSRTDELTRLLAEFRPDVVHAHNTFALISPSVYAAVARARVPVVQTLHNFRLLCLQGMFLRNGRVCEDCLGRFPWRGVLHRCYRGSAPQSGVVAAMIGLHRAIGYVPEEGQPLHRTDANSVARKFIAGGLPGDRIAVKSNFAESHRTRARGGRARGRCSWVGSHRKRGLGCSPARPRAVQHGRSTSSGRVRNGPRSRRRPASASSAGRTGRRLCQNA